jgi:threonine synthase
MKFYSTNSPDQFLPLREAVFNSLPADKGLYMPAQVPAFSPFFIQHLPQFSLQEIAFEVLYPYVSDEVQAKDLKKIIEESFDFEVPLKPLDAGLAVLELFHGPSLAFKDFGARFMSRLMRYLSKDDDRTLDVLVATSGDTGGAVALGFLGVEGTRVTILYPKGKVSPIQERQLTTLGQNIRAIAVEGSFDDCQRMVKAAFGDAELQKRFRLTSANSINIARLLPQAIYYVYAYAQLAAQGLREVVFSVPSGNLGNIGAGMLAAKMGLPVHQFIAASNENDVLSRYFQTGVFKPEATKSCISNAMDVGNPSNWVRLLALTDYRPDRLKQQLTTFAMSDEETRKGMMELLERYGYVACPHTAIAYLAAQRYRDQYPGHYATVFLATAHACKFPEVMEDVMLAKLKIPASVEMLSDANKQYDVLVPEESVFRDWLLSRAEVS